MCRTPRWVTVGKLAMCLTPRVFESFPVSRFECDVELSVAWSLNRNASFLF